MFKKMYILKKLSILVIALAVLISGLGISPASAASNKPKVEAIAVVEDTSVTFYAYYLPASARFDVLLSKVGKDGVYTGENGIKVGSFTATSSGSLEATVDLPGSLRDYRQIAIRLEGSSWYAYNFYDNYTWKGSKPVVTPQPGDVDQTIVKERIKFDQKVDVFNGNAGLFMPSSAYAGWVKLERFSASDAAWQRGLTFQQNLIDVGVYDSKMKLFEKVWGFNYLYFNLTSETRRAYNLGKLDIYRYNADKRSWEPCEVQALVATKGKYGRLSCLINEFGLYALATSSK